MVLQQNTKVPVWGTADDGEEVTVALQGQTVKAKAGREGKWVVVLERLKAGGPYEMTISGKNKIQYKNVLVGEVWVCSGQSNMEQALSNTRDPKEVIANAKNPMIRLLTIKRTPAGMPQTELPKQNGAWVEADPKTVPGFSAVAYYFGRALSKKLQVPVGLIHSSLGRHRRRALDQPGRDGRSSGDEKTEGQRPVQRHDSAVAAVCHPGRHLVSGRIERGPGGTVWCVVPGHD